MEGNQRGNSRRDRKEEVKKKDRRNEPARKEKIKIRKRVTEEEKMRMRR